MKPFDEHWGNIVAALPSAAFTSEQRERAFGFRLTLANMAAAKKDGVRYLEIGVRLGHSLAAVLLAAGDRLEYADGVDLWIAGYAGEPQAGAQGVTSALGQLGIDTNAVTLHSGDSHVILPLMVSSGGTYNLILVDGDHTTEGAAQDLADCWEMLESGGFLVFDDAYYAGDPRQRGPGGSTWLREVWDDFYLEHQHESIAREVQNADPPYCWLER